MTLDDIPLQVVLAQHSNAALKQTFYSACGPVQNASPDLWPLVWPWSGPDHLSFCLCLVSPQGSTLVKHTGLAEPLHRNRSLSGLGGG